jgi:TonB family protein
MSSPYRFELGLLPERRVNQRAMAASYGLVALFIMVLLMLGLIFPERLPLGRHYTVTELIPRPDLVPEAVKLKKSVPKTVVAKRLPPAPPLEKPALVVPKEVREPVKNQEIEPPQVVVNTFKPPAVPVGGARAPRVIYTGSFGSSATPTLSVAVQKVQTGGFGDPNGVKATGKPSPAITVAQVGSFDMPAGPGHGNGSGGAQGLKGAIASAGFGNGIAQPGQGDGRSNGHGAAVQTGAFGSQQLAPASPTRHLADAGPPTNPVEITFKPNPVYTEEARHLRLEGDVLLEVTFSSSGQLHVNRVVRGLGHGLDEAAVRAADQMRFKPALRNGVPVDSTAVVHVVFQLAY